MKKKRWIALTLCAAMLASTALTGCGGGKDKEEGGLRIRYWNQE